VTVENEWNISKELLYQYYSIFFQITITVMHGH